MKVEDVPAEAVLLFDALLQKRAVYMGRVTLVEILAAVAPLIATAERERCAVVAEAAAASWRLDAKDRVHWGAREECRVSAVTADDIAAAIRALD